MTRIEAWERGEMLYSSAAEYFALCFAEASSPDDIRDEIARCSQKRNYGWQDTGSAEADHIRVETLQAWLKEKT